MLSIAPSPHLKSLHQQLSSPTGSTAAWQIIDEYFDFMHVEDIKAELWLLTKGALTNDLLPQNQQGADRHHILYHYELLSLLLDAVKFLHDKRGQKPTSPAIEI